MSVSMLPALSPMLQKPSRQESNLRDIGDIRPPRLLIIIAWGVTIFAWCLLAIAQILATPILLLHATNKDRKEEYALRRAQKTR